MRRGTTPTHIFKLPFDVSEVKAVRIIYSQDDKEVLIKEKDDLTIDGTTATVILTQEETLKFHCNGYIEIQVRILTDGDIAMASKIIKLLVETCLEDEVL